MITVVAHIDETLFRDFAMFDMLRVKRGWRLPSGFAGILLISAAICFALRAQAQQAKLLAAVLAGVAVVLPLVYFGTFLYSIHAQSAKLGLSKAKHFYTLELSGEAEGISVTGSNGEHAKYRWADAYGAYRGKGCTYLYLTAGRAYLLPDGDVGAQREALEQLLRSHHLMK